MATIAWNRTRLAARRSRPEPGGEGGRVEDWRGTCRFDLSVAPCFRWECLTSQAVSRFSAPARSHAACGFPALCGPVDFPSRSMRPIALEPLWGAPTPTSPCSQRTDRRSRTTTPYSTVSSRSPVVCSLWPSVAEPSFPPRPDRSTTTGMMPLTISDLPGTRPRRELARPSSVSQKQSGPRGPPRQLI